MMEKGEERNCVLIPFMGRHESLRKCVARLLEQISDDTDILLVDDDNSQDDIRDEADFGPLFESGRVHVVRHGENRGVSVARNTGIRWALERGYDIVIMIDSDCLPGRDHVATHLSLHRQHPNVPVIGGAVRGKGNTYWARLDSMMTWFHCIPETRQRTVRAPYCVPTANLSVKIKMLPFGESYFDERLRTGEDTMFSKRVRAAGFEVLFFPVPEIEHQDRNSFRDVVRHQYEFGRHHIALLQADGGLKGLCFKPGIGLLLFPAILLALPFYVVAGCALNVWPWVKADRRHLFQWPAIQLMWMMKGVAFAEAVCQPRRAFRIDS